MSSLSIAATRAAKSRHLAAMTVAASTTAMIFMTTHGEEDDSHHHQQEQQQQQPFSSSRQQLNCRFKLSSRLGWQAATAAARPMTTQCQAAASQSSNSNNPLNHQQQQQQRVDGEGPRLLASSLLAEPAPGGPAPTTTTGTGAGASKQHSNGFTLRRRKTLNILKDSSTKARLSHKYDINPEPIGEGAFGQVFVARDKSSGELVAVKKIWKEFSNNQDFVREMSTLLHIRSHGTHPHICSLRENFDEQGHYALVLDLVKGGEMFDYLVENGAYSELEASRLIREVASALDYLHGIGVVHCDLKPENLMLSSKNNGSASIKLVDFGCSERLPGYDPSHKEGVTMRERKSGGTIAYAPPESFADDDASNMVVDAALDMWALGIILHIMLTGIHPFDPDGEATDEQLSERIRTSGKLDLQNSPHTAHLSSSAIDLLSQLLDPDPSKRLSAFDMLQHSWVRGETARSDIMKGSDRRLSKFRRFRSKIETKVFQELISWSHNEGRRDPSQNGESLVEKAFKSMDKEKKGFLTMDDIAKEEEEEEQQEQLNEEAEGEGDSNMTFSAFSDMLGENMQNKYFPRGYVIFKEGDRGEHMYFLNSGSCEVTTKGGFRATLTHGDTFGEGGLMTQNRQRSATIKTLTPVHAIQIDRQCFVKYLLGSDSALALRIKERINKRKFGRAEFIIGNQSNLQSRALSKGEKVFSEGDEPEAIYFLSEGKLEVSTQGNVTYRIEPGELVGVQSFYFNRRRESSVTCTSDKCVVKVMPAEEFHKLIKEQPELDDSLREKALRREFCRAIVRKLKVSMEEMELKDIFDAIDLDHSGKLSREEVRDLLSHLDVAVPELELERLLETLDLDNTGFINFQEFVHIFQK